MHLQELVATVAFEPGEEVVLGDLHRDRRGALLGRVRCEVRQRRSHQAAYVDAVVGEELLVLDDEERVDHGLRDVLVGDRLRVLEFVERDLLAVGVVHVGALSERLELGQDHREFLVRVRRRPDPGRDTDHGGGEQQRSGGDDQQQPRDESENSHAPERRYWRWQRAVSAGGTVGGHATSTRGGAVGRRDGGGRPCRGLPGPRLAGGGRRVA